jgi:predicted nucleic acid-binding protein
MSSFVVLDACVLVPASLCDLLLRAAGADLYRLQWTDEILEEVRHTLIDDLGRSAEQADRRIAAMKAAFPESLITHHKPLVSAMTNDPKDRHVLAAAVASSAHVIVTTNLKDFPERALVDYPLAVQSPDAFLTHLFASNPERVIAIIRGQAHALQQPPMTVDQVLDNLALHVPVFVRLLRTALNA